jgi:hypothetical protein
MSFYKISFWFFFFFFFTDNQKQLYFIYEIGTHSLGIYLFLCVRVKSLDWKEEVLLLFFEIFLCLTIFLILQVFGGPIILMHLLIKILKFFQSFLELHTKNLEEFWIFPSNILINFIKRHSLILQNKFNYLKIPQNQYNF